MSCRTLKIRVVPNARKTEAQGLMDDGETLKVKLAAPPVEGKANEALSLWIARQLKVRPSAVSILKGGRSRNKVIAVDGVTADAALAALTSKD